MVVGEVQEHPDRGPELLDPFELKARHLCDRTVDRQPSSVDERRAEVSAAERVNTRATEHPREQLGRGALSVRARDRVERCPERAISELDLGENRQAAHRGGPQQGVALRHPRARDHQIYALEKLRVLATETPLDREPAE